MILRAFVVTSVLAACQRTSVVDLVPDAGAVDAPADAGWTLSSEHLEAWLSWHVAVGALRRVDAGVPTHGEIKATALREVSLAADAGLSPSDLERIEDVVAVFVTERNVERLSGSLAITQFKGALSDLSPEQRVKAEAAFAEISVKTAPSPLPSLEARFGPETVKVLLDHEVEVTRIWDALLENR